MATQEQDLKNERRNFDHGFFSSEKVRWALEQIVYVERLTIFVGAGVSKDQGIYGWDALVQNVLASRLNILVKAKNTHGSGTHGNSVDDVEFAQRLVTTALLLPSASIADDLFEDDYRSARTRAARERKATTARNELLRNLIYGPPEQPREFTFRPSLAREIILLAAAVKSIDPHNDLHIVSTNYDDLFREVVEDESDEEVRSYVRDARLKFKVFKDAPPTDEASPFQIPIVPIHGFIPRKGPVSRRVVFSERDYVEWTSGSPFRDYVRDRMSLGTTLLIGTSLRDYNIIQYLKETNYGSQRASRIAVLPVQGDPSFDAFDQADFHLISQLRDGRARQLGMSFLVPDFYGQTLQLMTEARLLATSLESHYEPYLERLANWWADFSMTSYEDDEVRRSLTRALQEKSVQIRDRYLEPDDHCKIEIWLRPDIEVDPTTGDVRDSRCFELWVNSQSMWLSGSGYRAHRVPVSPRSDDPAVLAFASRSVAHGEITNRSDGRWTHYLATPIILGDDRYAHVPVGCAVLIVSCGSETWETIASDADRTIRNEISLFVANVGADALQPSLHVARQSTA